jgi:hypothetical protein
MTTFLTYIHTYIDTYTQNTCFPLHLLIPFFTSFFTYILLPTVSLCLYILLKLHFSFLPVFCLAFFLCNIL